MQKGYFWAKFDSSDLPIRSKRNPFYGKITMATTSTSTFMIRKKIDFFKTSDPKFHHKKVFSNQVLGFCFICENSVLHWHWRLHIAKAIFWKSIIFWKFPMFDPLCLCIGDLNNTREAAFWDQQTKKKVAKSWKWRHKFLLQMRGLQAAKHTNYLIHGNIGHRAM